MRTKPVLLGCYTCIAKFTFWFYKFSHDVRGFPTPSVLYFQSPYLSKLQAYNYIFSNPPVCFFVRLIYPSILGFEVLPVRIQGLFVFGWWSGCRKGYQSCHADQPKHLAIKKNRLKEQVFFLFITSYLKMCSSS